MRHPRYSSATRSSRATLLPIASANSGEEQNASANDAETASVQLTSEDDAYFRFGGSADAEITGDAGSGAFADPGGGTSAASYEFLATSGELLRINYTTKSDFDRGRLSVRSQLAMEQSIKKFSSAPTVATQSKLILQKGRISLAFLLRNRRLCFSDNGLASCPANLRGRF
jgi:hypothetical protein